MIDKLSIHWERFMKDMGLNIEDPSLRDTPQRVAKMYINDLCRGLYEDSPRITTFPNDNHYDDMLVVKDIQVQSLCEHHFLPFVGVCHIAYYPKDKIVGLSKFARIVDHFARRPQVQERLTMDIYNYLTSLLATDDIAIYISAEHFCMKVRGAKQSCSSTVTTKMGGRFLQEYGKNKFYTIIG